MKRSIVLACASALVASLVGCGGGDKDVLPTQTAASSPATTATVAATTPPPTASSGPVPLAAHSTYTYGGLQLVVNLPVDIPAASRPSMRIFSDFLQGVGRTTAQNTLDPSLSGLASADVVKFVRTFIEGPTDQGTGSVIFTISNVHAVPHGPSLITGCLDQSRLVQLRPDGSHYIDANTRKYPTLKVAASIDTGAASSEVNHFTYAVGSC